MWLLNSDSVDHRPVGRTGDDASDATRCSGDRARDARVFTYNVVRRKDAVV